MTIPSDYNRVWNLSQNPRRSRRACSGLPQGAERVACVDTRARGNAAAGPNTRAPKGSRQKARMQDAGLGLAVSKAKPCVLHARLLDYERDLSGILR
jgi:hypothetical protein